MQNARRSHLILGCYGIYLSMLTAFILFGGIFQTCDIISTAIKIKLLGPEWREFPMQAYWMYTFSFLVAIHQTIAGFLGLNCIIITPSPRKIRTLALLLCSIQFFTILRDVAWGDIRISTFTYFHRAILIFVLSEYWKRYQQNLLDEGILQARGLFPFLREFHRYRRKGNI